MGRCVAEACGYHNDSACGFSCIPVHLADKTAIDNDVCCENNLYSAIQYRDKHLVLVILRNSQMERKDLDFPFE